jgi:hypothetical protein
LLQAHDWEGFRTTSEAFQQCEEKNKKKLQNWEFRLVNKNFHDKVMFVLADGWFW